MEAHRRGERSGAGIGIKGQRGLTQELERVPPAMPCPGMLGLKLEQGAKMKERLPVPARDKGRPPVLQMIDTRRWPRRGASLGTGAGAVQSGDSAELGLGGAREQDPQPGDEGGEGAVYGAGPERPAVGGG